MSVSVTEVSVFLSMCLKLKSLSLPDCWVRDFFMAHMYTELQMITEALQKYQSLKEAGFSKSTYIISQIAVAYHNIRGLDHHHHHHYLTQTYLDCNLNVWFGTMHTDTVHREVCANVAY